MAIPKSIDERVDTQSNFWRLLKPTDQFNALKAVLYASAIGILVVSVGYCNHLSNKDSSAVERQRIETVKTITDKYGDSMRPEELRAYLNNLGLISNK